MEDERNEEEAWIVIRKPSPKIVLLTLGVVVAACIIGYFGGRLLL